MAKFMTFVSGSKQVLANLKRANSQLAAGFGRGARKGGHFLQRESLKIVPRDEGNLANSSFVRHSGSGWYTDVIIGYTAGYAIYVHEDLTKRHGAAYNEAYGGKKRGPDQQAKFLEDPAKKFKREILKVIHTEAKL